MPRLKRFLSDVSEGRVPQTLWTYHEVGHTQEAKKELLEFVSFEHTENVLNSVKPTRLLRRILQVGTVPDSGDIVLDFFAGSGAAGHAVWAQNQEDGGNRRFMLVQLPEPLPKQESHVRTIADLGKSRLRNYGASLAPEGSEGDEAEATLPGLESGERVPDVGFRVHTLDSSGIRAWDPDIASLDDDLLEAVENIKADRSDGDILYELLLKYGLDLAIPIEERRIARSFVHVVGGGALIVCLAKEVSLDLVEKIGALKAELEPEVMRVVFLDSAFPDDVVKTNAVQILRHAGIEDIKSL
jgi:adenine-specific DNA-methyltransferase